MLQYVGLAGIVLRPRSGRYSKIKYVYTPF